MSRDASTIANYLVYGIDLVKRRVYFGNSDDTEDTNDFKESNTNLIIRSIDKMLDISNAPIEIHMESYGGDPFAMLALKDKILESPCQFKFYGRGRISSAATWIMCVCDERYLSADTTVMIHDGSDWFEGNTTDMDIYTAYNNEMQHRLNEIYAENSYLPKSIWDKLVRRDLFITAEEAKALGLIDGIVPHKKRGNLRKGVRAETFKNLPSKSRMEALIKKLSRRIKMDDLLEIKIEVPKEQFEKIDSYDNTATELEKITDGQSDK